MASTVEDESGKVIKENEPANVVKVKKQKVNNEIKPEVVVKEKPETFGKFKKLSNKVSNLVNKISENIDNYRNGIEETRIQNRANKLARKGAKHEREMKILAKKSQAADLASEFNNQKLGNKLAQNDVKVSIREQKLADKIAKREAALLIEKQNEALRLAEKEAMENLGNGVSSEVEGKRNGFFGLFTRTKESLPKPEAKLNKSIDTEKSVKEPNYFQRKYAEVKANRDSKKAYKDFLKAVDELNNVNETITVEKLNQKISGKKSKFSNAIDKVSGFFNRKQKPVETEKLAEEITPDFEFNVKTPKNGIFDERKLNEFKSHSDISAYAKQQMAESNKNLINKFAKVTPKKHETRQQALDKAFGANKELDADIKAFDETSELRKIQKDLEITGSWNDQQLTPINRKYSLGKLFGKKERKEATQIQNDIKKGFNEIEQQRKNAKLSITDEIEFDDDAQAWLQRKK